MNTKKILLPENPLKERSRGRKRRKEEKAELMVNENGVYTTRPSRSKCAPLVTDQRQRNEAVGLVMLGFSAFSLSLIHYISSSGIPGLINATMVYLGVGVYIIPTLVGLMGIQKFLERPFQNLGWRIAGSVGVVLSSLGLFYTEGGKIGSWIYSAMAGTFGGIPTKILFTAILFSSMIFALDILYKDVLATGLVIAGLTMRFLKFCWEVTLSLVSMSMGAIKTTSNFCAVTYQKIRQYFAEKQTDPDSKLGQLLAFKPHTNTEVQDNPDTTNNSVKESEEPEKVHMAQVISLNQGKEETAAVSNENETVIPEPQIWNSNIEEETKQEANSVAEVSNQQVMATSSVIVSNVTSECIFVSSTSVTVPTVDASPTNIQNAQPMEQQAVKPYGNVIEMPVPSTTDTETSAIEEKATESDKKEDVDYFNQIDDNDEAAVASPTESVHQSEITETENKEEINEVSDSRETEQNNMSEETTKAPSETTERTVCEEECTDKSSNDCTQAVSHETFVEKEQVYIEDNRIDQIIKANEKVEAMHVNKYAESKLPPIEILKIPPVTVSNAEAEAELSYRSAHLLKTLDEFGIKASVTAIVQGPAVSRFELKPAPGVKVRSITSLTDDIALSLAAQSIAIEAPIPGKSALGIIIPNNHPTPVFFYNLLKDSKFSNSTQLLNMAIGVTINGQNVYADLAEMPHLLIAGSTGSGKSVCVNSIIASILFKARADQVKFIMIDPKMVELSNYNGIPHLIAPVVTDPAKASGALMWAVEEMERRYDLLAKCQGGIKNIATYNEKLESLREENPALEPMPYIVIVIDELADLMMTCSKEVEGSICRLTQMARAVGMHLIIATQRPSVDVITGLIKANLPSRIAFSVSSQVDSKTILDTAGAEKLLGKGDMLFLPKGKNKPLRLQGPYVSDNELCDLINFVKSQGSPEYLEIAVDRSKKIEDEDEDDVEEDSDATLMQQITKYLETQEKTSTSMLQRKFRIGYNRAARIMDELEELGIVSPSDGSKQRRVIGRSSSQV